MPDPITPPNGTRTNGSLWHQLVTLVTDRKTSAFAVVCGLVVFFAHGFVDEFRKMREDAKEDRATFREDLKDIRSADSSRTQRIVDRLDKVREAVEQNTRTVERQGMTKGGVRPMSFVGPFREMAPMPTKVGD